MSTSCSTPAQWGHMLILGGSAMPSSMAPKRALVLMVLYPDSR
jgi:hypothetical protein